MPTYEVGDRLKRLGRTGSWYVIAIRRLRGRVKPDYVEARLDSLLPVRST